MFAAATAEHPAGYIEYLKPEKTAEGLKVTVYSVSPFAVIWTSNEQQQTTPVTGDGTVWFALLAVISLGGAVIGVRKAGKKD
jgi:LPXTG-motif cell wall-anchored protein